MDRLGGCFLAVRLSIVQGISDLNSVSALSKRCELFGLFSVLGSVVNQVEVDPEPLWWPFCRHFQHSLGFY